MKPLKLYSNVRVYYPRYVSEIGFWEHGYYDSFVGTITRHGNYVVGKRIFSHKTLRCINFINPDVQFPFNTARIKPLEDVA